MEVRGLEEVAPGFPVVFGERVFDTDDRVLTGERFVELGELLVGEPLALIAVRVLKVEVVLLLFGLVELAGGTVKGNLDFSGVASLFDGGGDEIKSLFSGLDIRSDTTLVTNISCRLAVLLLGESLEFLVDLGTLAETLRERRGVAKDLA